MNVTISNPIIRDFLDGRTNRAPLAEIKYLLQNPETKPSFLDDVEKKTSNAILMATAKRKMRFPSDQITRHLVIIAYAHEVYRENSSAEEKEKVLKEVADSLKYLWNVIDMV